MAPAGGLPTTDTDTGADLTLPYLTLPDLTGTGTGIGTGTGTGTGTGIGGVEYSRIRIPVPSRSLLVKG